MTLDQVRPIPGFPKNSIVAKCCLVNPENRFGFKASSVILKADICY